MAPVNQQSSRAGLITAVVVLTIISVTMTIFAFWSNAGLRKSQDDMDSLRKKYQDIISDSMMAGDEVRALQDLRKSPDSGYTPDMKVFQVALAQRDRLIKMITGNDASDKNTCADANRTALATLAAVDAKAKAAGATIPSTAENLAGATGALADALTQRQAEIKQLDAKVMEADQRAQEAIKQKDDALAAKDADIAKIRAAADAETAAADADRAAKQKQLADIEKAREDERKAEQDAMAKKDVEVSSKAAEAKKLAAQLDAIRAKFEKMRVDVTSPMVRHASGTIIRIPSSGIVFINRGQGDQIIPGMTFEVYDRTEGIPKLGDPLSDENLPVGKASIEVTRVLPDESECRVVRVRPGSSISEGDLIMNLVYDPTTKYNFVVYGKFDLDQNGVATAQETEAVKRLIRQWGGRVSDHVNVDTDFIVLGKEPEVPDFTADDLTHPENVKKKKDAEDELDAYQNILQEGRELHIPILNQNRFLYFTGYYDLAKR